jgi:hypothetical protein
VTGGLHAEPIYAVAAMQVTVKSQEHADIIVIFGQMEEREGTFA